MRKHLFLAFLGVRLLHAANGCAEPESIWRLRTLSDPQIHPSGRSALYAEEWNDSLADTSYSSLREVSLRDGTTRPVTTGNFRDSSARWSPDGSRLAYISNRSGRARIHVRATASGKEGTIDTGEYAPSQLAWSPDGKWIAFLMFAPSEPEWAPAMPEKPQAARWAPPPVAVTQLRWTFDGAGVLKPGTNRVFAVPVAGGLPRQITPEGSTTLPISSSRNSPGLKTAGKSLPQR